MKTLQYNSTVSEKRAFPSRGVQYAIPKPRPYILSSIALSFYVFTIVILSKNPEFFNISQYVGFGLAGIFAFELIARRGRFWFPKELTSFVFFLMIMVVGALWSPAPDIAISRSLTFFQLLIFGIIALNIMIIRKSVKAVAIGIIVGLLWAVITALNEQSFRFMALASYKRIASVLNNANLYAIGLSIGCMLAWYLLINTERKIVRIFLVALILLFIHQILFYTGSRKGIMAIFIVYPAYLFLRQIFQTQPSLLKIIGMVFSIIIFYYIGWRIIQYSIFFSRVLDLQDDLIEGSRGQMIKFAFDLWRARPVLGQGTDQFRVVSPFLTYSHSNYMELLANNGLIGFFCFYSFFVVMIKKYINLFQREYLTIIDISWSLSFILFLLIMDIALVSYYDKLIWLAYVILIGLSYISQQGNKSFPKTPDV